MIMQLREHRLKIITKSRMKHLGEQVLANGSRSVICSNTSKQLAKTSHDSSPIIADTMMLQT